ncbi:hypothetical protein KC19_7G076500 [Ceratodon purpureus]|uniref:CWF19-like protein 2 n=1 Tax=Ceratodon purpureus TaxID=3225 RepID=A0A8T0HBX0_CERPU|nr:hypothetical protein KC19_7G076500 [Ceratodon purpureus]
MLGAVRFVPREELPAADVEGSDGERKSGKKRKHGSKEERADRKGKSKHRDEKRKHGGKERRSKHKRSDEEEVGKEYSSDEASEDSEGLASRKINRGLQESKRKEAGLEWMNLAPERPPAPKQDDALRLEPEKPVSNVKELNPYWKNDGIGLPTEAEKGGLSGGGRGRLPPPPGVGDGGASWRMKALKRAQEQAAREGKQLDEVVEERWGSLASLTNSVAVQRAAHANAHMHAKRDRTRKADDRVSDAPQAVEGKKGEEANVPEDEDDRRIRTGSRDYLKDVKAKDNRMRQPQVDRKLSWRNKGSIRPEDAAVLRAAAQTYNKFSDDGDFLKSFGSSKPQEEPKTSTRVSTVTSTTRVESIRTVKEIGSRDVKADTGAHVATVSKSVTRVETLSVAKDASASNVKPSHDVKSVASTEPTARVDAHQAGKNSDMEPSSSRVVDTERKAEGSGVQVHNLSSNQIAAKVMQLRLRGKHKEADELQKQGEAAANVAMERPPEEEKQSAPGPLQVLARLEALGKKTLELRRESADKAMAGMIGQNKMYKADDEYDDLGPHAEKKKKKPAQGANQRPTVQNYNRIQTQAERCQLCFDNVNRPKHLTMAIANFTYLTLPPRRPLVNGHCYIVPMQHEGATCNVDDDTWEELRNFKKCLVRMFDEQNKEAIFLETAMHLTRQKRHCVVECIPIPSSFAKDAPLYFKKAIDEAESEWSQHNAKRLIDTRIKGLRSSVPKNFPYFHVEFGMNGGYAHVIDDESKFKPEFGRAVLEGMLQIEEEDFHMQTLSRKDQEKFAKDFAKMWEPHDWTKMLE